MLLLGRLKTRLSVNGIGCPYVCVKSNRETLCLSLISYTVEGLSLFKVFFTLLFCKLSGYSKRYTSPSWLSALCSWGFSLSAEPLAIAVWVAVVISYTVEFIFYSIFFIALSLLVNGKDLKGIRQKFNGLKNCFIKYPISERGLDIFGDHKEPFFPTIVVCPTVGLLS